MSHFSNTASQPLCISAVKVGVLSRVFAALAVWRSRHHLNTLEAHMLDDIGVSANQAKAEAKRPIWDVPAHWTQ